MNTDENTLQEIHLDKDSYTLTEVVEKILSHWELTMMRNDAKYGKTKVSSLNKQIRRKFKSRRMSCINSNGVARYRREDVEHFLNDTDVRKYLLKIKIEWHNELLGRSNMPENKISEAKAQLEKAYQEMQIIADAEGVVAEYSENAKDYFAHANDDDETVIEGLKIEETKRRILFQVLSDFVFNDVIEFDEAAYRRDLRSKPDDGDIKPSPWQVLAGRRLLDLRNYYKFRSDVSPEKTALTQEMYRMLTDLRKDIRQDITEVLHRYNKDKNKIND